MIIDKKIDSIINFLEIANKLKETERWASLACLKRRESSADHSWKMSLMTMILFNELNIKVDEAKVLKMAIVHDLVEAITGDIDHSLVATGAITKEQKVKGEKSAIKFIKKVLPSKSGKEIFDIWYEFEQAKTPEARFAKALDRLETINHYLISFDIKKNGRKKGYRPDLLAVYGDKALSEFPELLPVLKKLKAKLKVKYKQAGIDWLPEYNNVFNK